MFAMDGEIEFLDGIIEGELINETPVLTGEIFLDDISYPALTGDLVIAQSEMVPVPPYDGSYDITPMPEMEQVLETAGKRLEDDVIIAAIPYYETTNESGGYTVIIG